MTRACQILTLTLISVLSFAARADAQRIVALGSGVTEMIYALGEQARLVGVDTSSRYPPAATRLPQVGYQRTLGAEGILSLKPDLVLGTTQAGPAEVLDKLRAAGVAVELLPAPRSLESAYALLQSVADRLGKPDAGRAIIAASQARLQKIKARTPNGPAPRVLALLSVQGGSLLAAGTDSAADLMIGLANGVNAASGYTGYRPLSAEALMQLAPDVILVPSHALPMMGGREALLSLPGIAHTAAARGGRIVIMDSSLLLGLGPRLGEGVEALAAELHLKTRVAAKP